MKIELLENQTVKIVLTNDDMQHYNLTYDDMDYKNPQTKQVIADLIKQIKLSCDLDLSTGKLFIEAFPYADGGCILYVNMLILCGGQAPIEQRVYRNSFSTPIIYSFADINSLGCLAKRMLSRYSHAILKSSLYFYQAEYYLMIYTYFKMDSKLSILLKEYALYYGKGAIPCAVIKEHAKEIIEDNAIETLSLCL